MAAVRATRGSIRARTMTPTFAAAVDVAETLAWYPIANGTGSSDWYRERQEAAIELATRLDRVRVRGASEEDRLLLVAMRRAARASYCNRTGAPYYERREAILQLRAAIGARRLPR